MSNEHLHSLNDKSVWVFTKQETDFDESFNATKLFADVCERDDINIEKYFAEHSFEYGIKTDRHRIFAVAQLLGLITKTPFYVKGTQYRKERPTAIFESIRNCEVGDSRYNTVKTEQLLKVKIHAIIDTAKNNIDYNILPVLYIYRVLKSLRDQYQIERVSTDLLWTYAMTCKSYDQLDNTVKYIKNNSDVSTYVKQFKNNSRVLSIIKKNLLLFNLNDTNISLNPIFDDYFNDRFVDRFDFEALHEQLLRNVDYSYFLYNDQGFNINLIDTPAQNDALLSAPIKEESGEDEKERTYQNKVDSIKESTFNEDVANESHKIAPIGTLKTNVATRFERNPLLGKIAIKKADYSCELDSEHKTFTSNRTLKPYMEAHHLIPIVKQEEIWKKYYTNIDCIENLISLCPTCHKAFHYGTSKIKNECIEKIYAKIVDKYKAIGFDISVDEIKEFYGA